MRLNHREIANDRAPRARTRPRVGAPVDAAVVGFNYIAVRVEHHLPRVDVWTSAASIGIGNRCELAAGWERGIPAEKPPAVATDVNDIRAGRVGND